MERGFSFIETMVAMSISVVVLLANLYLFNTAWRNFSFSRAVSSATNLATSQIAKFRTMTITQIIAAPPETDPTIIDGVPFTRTWVVSDVDLDQDGTPEAEIQGRVVKVRLDVGWTQANKQHHVTMATFIAEKSE